jgi:hypothetical protein
MARIEQILLKAGPGWAPIPQLPNSLPARVGS